MASSAAPTPGSNSDSHTPPDLKINLIYPCTSKHIKKYSSQSLHLVTETPQIYKDHVRPYMQKQREEGRLNWIFNIIEGRTEQEDVLYREHGKEGFLLLPDLNWDRKTITNLHLLGLVERRDLWSLRDLREEHVVWLKHMRTKLIEGTVKLYPEIERDMLKLYVHCSFSCFPYDRQYMLMNEQINQHTTISTFTLSTYKWKQAVHKLLVKLSVLII
jgi:m7GpppX diphosphatase